MNTNLSSLILYTDGARRQILNDFILLSEECRDNAQCRDAAYKISGELLETAYDYGFSSDAWQSYIALVAVTSDNVFCRACERQRIGDCTLRDFARRDADILYKFFNYEFTEIENKLNIDCFSMLKNYRAADNARRACFFGISKRLNELVPKLRICKDSEEFFDCLCTFYECYGYGILGLNRSFHFNDADDKIVLEPIFNTHNVSLDDIVGYESQKHLLYSNTKAFIDKKPSNNVLLYGDSGTGKSTSIKAIADEFYDSGLRMIEIYKHQFEKLPGLISYLSGKNYRFIIYLDDLSFEENETEYKYLKAVIDGGVQNKPENILIYATSNRRHLVRETWRDRSDMTVEDDIHSGDTVEEKLSLAARFGLNIYYPKPGRDEYMEIVEKLAQRNNIDIDSKTLQDRARIWEMHHGGISGRTAAQFIADLLGNQ